VARDRWKLLRNLHSSILEAGKQETASSAGGKSSLVVSRSVSSENRIDIPKSILIKGNVCVCVRCPDESIALTASKSGTQVVLIVTPCTSKPEF
ncbi:hypothetical protein AVEN_236265-1, partial [Araneus ventricosus]